MIFEIGNEGAKAKAACQEKKYSHIVWKMLPLAMETAKNVYIKAFAYSPVIFYIKVNHFYVQK